MRPIWALPILLLATAIVFYPGLSGDFLFDDYPNIVSNPKIQISELSTASLITAAHAFDPGLYGRPLATISFALDYLQGGKHPRSYKVSNLILHLFNAGLIFLLCSQLLRLTQAGKPLNAFAPLAIALIWAVHPLQISTVLYVVQRMEILSLSFVLLGLITYIHGRQRQKSGKGGWAWLFASGLIASAIQRNGSPISFIYLSAGGDTIWFFLQKKP